MNIKNTISTSKLNIESLVNHQLISLIPKDNMINSENEEYQVAININNLSSTELAKLLNTNERLRVDFFKFELYKDDNMKPDILSQILLQVSVNTKDFEFFLDYLFIQNNIECIYNICLNSSTLFENQVALIIKKLLSLSEDISKEIKKDSLGEFIKFQHEYLSNKTINNSSLIMFMISRILANASFNQTYFLKALLIELRDLDDKYDLKAFVNLFHIVLSLSTITENPIYLLHLNTILDCFLFFYKKAVIDISIIDKLFTIVSHNEDLHKRIDSFSQDDNIILRLKMYLTSYNAITYANSIKMNTDSKNVFFDRIII